MFNEQCLCALTQEKKHDMYNDFVYIGVSVCIVNYLWVNSKMKYY